MSRTENRRKAAEKSKIHPIPIVVLTAIPVVLIAAFYLLRSNREFMNRAVFGVVAPYRGFVASALSRVPFSVGEILYTCFFIWAAIFVVVSVVKVIRSRRKLSTLATRIFVLALVFLYIWSGCCWLWNSAYYADGFSKRSGFYAEDFTTEDLIRVTELFAANANEYSVKVKRDENGRYCEDVSAFFSSYGDIFDPVIELFPCLDGDTYRPKAMIISQIMSYTGFTGIYFPLTGETNVNVDSPSFYIPSTIAHEIAHQHNIAPAQDANFLGIVACLGSSRTTYRYSGCLLGLTSLMNALYRADKDAWERIYDSISDEIKTDWAENSAYWQSKKTFIDTISDRIYERYLKGNGQSLGLKSYGACVNLLVTMYK